MFAAGRGPSWAPSVTRAQRMDDLSWLAAELGFVQQEEEF